MTCCKLTSEFSTAFEIFNLGHDYGKQCDTNSTQARVANHITNCVDIQNKNQCFTSRKQSCENAWFPQRLSSEIFLGPIVVACYHIVLPSMFGQREWKRLAWLVTGMRVLYAAGLCGLHFTTLISILKWRRTILKHSSPFFSDSCWPETKS